MLFMDVDPLDEIEWIASVCLDSGYSLDELKRVFLNEVFQAVGGNRGVAPEWKGFPLDWLTERILRVHRFQKRLPWKLFHPDAYASWDLLESAIVRLKASR